MSLELCSLILNFTFSCLISFSLSACLNSTVFKMTFSILCILLVIFWTYYLKDLPQFNVFHFNRHLNFLVVVITGLSMLYKIFKGAWVPEIMLVTVTNCVVAKYIFLLFATRFAKQAKPILVGFWSHHLHRKE